MIHHLAKAAPSSVVSLALSAPLVATNVRPVYHSHANTQLSAALQYDDSHIGRTAGAVRSCRPPIVLHRRDQLAASAAWIGAVSKPGMPGARRHSTRHEHDQCRRDGEQGSEVSLRSFSLSSVRSETALRNRSLFRLTNDTPDRLLDRLQFCRRFSSFNWSAPIPPYSFGGKTVHWTLFFFRLHSSGNRFALSHRSVE